MIGTSFLESGGVILTIVTPLVAVPLTIITFYLRSLREHQVSRHADMVRHLDVVENTVATLRQALTECERDYTTKEEWLRECMLARRTLHDLSEKSVRIETMLQHLTGAGSQPPDGRATVPPAHRRDNRQEDKY